MAGANHTFATIVHDSPPPLVQVSGTHREMGQQIGESCRENVQHSIRNARIVLENAFAEVKLTWVDAQSQAQNYLPFAQEHYPQYVEEIQGIAEGANVPFIELLVLNAIEELTMDVLHLTHCTSIGVSDERTVSGNVLAAHSEEWLSIDEDDVYVIQAKPKDEPPYLAMTYGGLLPNVGFNACGIAQLIDSVYPNDSRIGSPRLVVSRAVLAAKTPEEAIRCTIVSDRAAGYNHLIVHESGEIYNVESSANRFALLSSEDGVSVHTNHYLSSQMKEVEDSSDGLIGSRVRYYRAQRLLNRTRQHSIQSLQDILSDHVNYPNSICKHVAGDNAVTNEKTINALVIDLTAREMHIAWGNPCQNDYAVYQLDG
jgi:isopenicillin-N N-acyltransferase-like protein